jgi:hypothetical protein
MDIGYMRSDYISSSRRHLAACVKIFGSPRCPPDGSSGDHGRIFVRGKNPTLPMFLMADNPLFLAGVA